MGFGSIRQLNIGGLLAKVLIDEGFFQKAEQTMFEQAELSQRNSPALRGGQLISQAIFIVGVLAIMWGLEIFDLLLPFIELDNWGIVPRRPRGLRNIFFAPFLHVGLGHLIANSVPFLVLGWLVALRSRRDLLLVSIITALVSGLGVWLIAPTNTIHLGASGVIFGYLGYLLARAYFERSCASLAIAAIVFIVYGSMLWGVLPTTGLFGARISWQGHLFGFLGGGLAAWLLAERAR